MKGECLVKEIQMKNFRSLKDTGMQKLSPITILVGENSSGKSTFLRAFPLLKQSISKRTSGPILWAGDVDDYVDFGSFKETVTNDNSTSITFKFKFSINDNNSNRRAYRYDSMGNRITLDNVNQEILYDMTISSSDGKEYVSHLTLTINATVFDFDLVEMRVSSNGGLQFQAHDKKKLSTDADASVPMGYNSYRAYSRAFGFVLPDIADLLSKIANYVSAEDGKEVDWYAFRQLVNDIGVRLINNTKLNLLNSKKDTKRYSSLYLQLYNSIVSAIQNDGSGELLEICKLAYIYKYFTTIIDDFIDEYFRQVHYIAPLRATAERYYRLRNLAVDEVDYQGKNLPIFINSLTSTQLRAFQAWTNEHFGFSVNTDKSGGHISLQIQLCGSDKKINLSDTGFGYSQVLPIITQLWELSTQKKDIPHKIYGAEDTIPLVIAIEQPELHLHPAIQAKLAKAFIACIDLARKNKRELQLLIETHSQTIVDCFGRAIANEHLKPEDVSIVLFEKNICDNATYVRNSNYDENGFLRNWPYGFFDSED